MKFIYYLLLAVFCISVGGAFLLAENAQEWSIFLLSFSIVAIGGMLMLALGKKTKITDISGTFCISPNWDELIDTSFDEMLKKAKGAFVNSRGECIVFIPHHYCDDDGKLVYKYNDNDSFGTYLLIDNDSVGLICDGYYTVEQVYKDDEFDKVILQPVIHTIAIWCIRTGCDDLIVNDHMRKGIVFNQKNGMNR